MTYKYIAERIAAIGDGLNFNLHKAEFISEDAFNKLKENISQLNDLYYEILNFVEE